MIQWEDIKPGMEVMWGNIEFSNSFRVSKIYLPKKYRVKKVAENVVELDRYSVDGKAYYNRGNFYKSWYGESVGNTLYYPGVDEEEFMEDWNRSINDKIDGIHSESEKKEERLKKKLLTEFPKK